MPAPGSWLFSVGCALALTLQETEATELTIGAENGMLDAREITRWAPAAMFSSHYARTRAWQDVIRYNTVPYSTVSSDRGEGHATATVVGFALEGGHTSPDFLRRASTAADAHGDSVGLVLYASESRALSPRHGR